MDLTKQNLQIERTAKEGRIYVDRLARVGRRSDNPLLRAYSGAGTMDPDTLNRMTRQLQKSMASAQGSPMGSTRGLGSGGRSARSGAMKSSRGGAGAGAGSWDELQPQVKSLQEELAALDAEVAEREVALNDRVIKATGTNKAGPICPEGMSPFIKGGSTVMGSNFKWTKTMDKSVYTSDLAWPVQNPSTNVIFMGGRYGDVTRELDIPGGNVHCKPGMATRQIRPMDRTSSTKSFVKISFNRKDGN